MREARKPQMDLRAACATGGRPGALFVSPDGSRLWVFDRERARVTVIGIAKWQILDQIDLALPAASPAWFLAGFEESIFLGGLPGRIEVFDAIARRLSGSIPCAGEACDLGFLPEIRQAVLSSVAGQEGFLEFLGLSPLQTLARVELPLPPVRDTLTLHARQGVGAVVMRDISSGDAAVALFDCGRAAEPAFIRLDGGLRSVAFESEGRYLYAACHDDSSLAVIDVREQRVVEHVLLAGEPYAVAGDAVGRRVWALCEKIGHVAFIDPQDHMVFHRTPMSGLAPGRKGIAFSPEGRLAVVPETLDGGLSLVEGGEPGAHYGESDDRLELGRDIGEVAWSPLGEEIYVSSPDTGAVLRLAVDRGDQLMKDTDLYLMDQLLRQEESSGVKNPLFPP